MNAQDKVKAQIKARLTELRRLEREDAMRRLSDARKDKVFAEAERALAKAQLAAAAARARGESDRKLETGLKKAQEEYDAAARRIGADVSVHRRCAKCGDQGFDKNGAPCDCIREQYVSALKRECGADGIPQFTFDDDRSAKMNCAQSDALIKLYDVMKKFCAKFDGSRIKFVLLCGQAGTGKSSLAYATANELLSRGHSVCCLSAFDFNNALLKYHTSRLSDRAAVMEPLTDSDFLVIDDLGSETVLRNVTLEYLYNIVESRLNRGKRTMITTNLSLEELMARYGERTVSRMLNKRYALAYDLKGDDLRLFRS